MHLYTAARVLTGKPGAVIHQGAVLVEGQRIAWVGPLDQLDPDRRQAAGHTDLGPGTTILPGLIDSHVHLGFDGGPDVVASMQAGSDAEQLIIMLRNAAELLGAGVTSARDLGARSFLDINVREGVDAGLARGPRLVTAARPLTPTGGHCWFMGGECDSATEARRLVRAHHKAGADWVKVMATGGGMTATSMPWQAQFDEQELRAVTTEAHRLGRRVAAHAHGTPGIRLAVAAGVDTIEHCTWMGPDGSPHFDPQLAEAIAAAGIYVCPTLNARAHSAPPELLERFVTNVEKMHAAGIELIAGTDAGIDLLPHGAYAHGLEVMAKGAMTTAEVIEAATVRAATALGLAEVTGTLEAGKDADLVGVAGDPLADLSCLRRPTLILTRGWAYPPNHLMAPQPPDVEEGPGGLEGLPARLQARLKPSHRPLRRAHPHQPGPADARSTPSGPLGGEEQRRQSAALLPPGQVSG